MALAYRNPKVRTFDGNLVLKAAGLIAADTTHAILDLGGDGECRGEFIVDASAIEIATGDESYRLRLQGSNSATFASGVENLVDVILGAAALLGGGGATVDVASLPGRYIMPFTNEKNGTVYRYLRLNTDVTGTIATGINYTAWLSMDPK